MEKENSGEVYTNNRKLEILKKIENGENPYPYKFNVSMTIGSLA